MAQVFLHNWRFGLNELIRNFGIERFGSFWVNGNLSIGSINLNPYQRKVIHQVFCLFDEYLYHLKADRIFQIDPTFVVEGSFVFRMFPDNFQLLLLMQK